MQEEEKPPQTDVDATAGRVKQQEGCFFTKVQTGFINSDAAAQEEVGEGKDLRKMNSQQNT